MLSSQFIVRTPHGSKAIVAEPGLGLSEFIDRIVHSLKESLQQQQQPCSTTTTQSSAWTKQLYLTHQDKVLDETMFAALLLETNVYNLALHARLLGGTDRQNRVGSKFGGGGVSSSQQTERERKDRLKRLALEGSDLAKDPYLVRNHLGSLECKLCLTLHRDEANYLAHTQGKKHQQGLARRAHLEVLRQERNGSDDPLSVAALATTSTKPTVTKRVKIGRPAYQVFKSRDAVTNQRCLSFELAFPEIADNLQPRHRFMSAFEQRIEQMNTNNNQIGNKYQYLLIAADPYETVAFKIPNEPIDKDPEKFVTHWDDEVKKFILTLHFVTSEHEAKRLSIA
jgi:splicing factor 3A subunit 2